MGAEGKAAVSVVPGRLTRQELLFLKPGILADWDRLMLHLAALTPPQPPATETEPCGARDPLSPRKCTRATGHEGLHEDATLPTGATERTSAPAVSERAGAKRCSKCGYPTVVSYTPGWRHCVNGACRASVAPSESVSAWWRRWLQATLDVCVSLVVQRLGRRR